MRRHQTTALGIVALLVGFLLFAAGCSDSRPYDGKVVTPTPTKVVGKVPKPEAPGKSVFVAQSCGACHTFKPAAATGTVGPDLDKLAQYAQAANAASVGDFVSTSIVDPEAYVEKGYPAGVMPTTYKSLSQKDLQDLVAFLTQGS